MMKIEAIAIGQPRFLNEAGREVWTSIFKTTVPGPVLVRRHNLEGDRQADPSVHGGEYKAVYAYAAEHYAYWEAQLGRDLAPGSFGENLLISGLEEPAVTIGQVFGVGTSQLEATAPRLPCFKLGLRFGDPSMVKAFARAGRFGLYFRVVAEGRVAVGDEVRSLLRPAFAVPAYEIARLALQDRGDAAGLRRLIAVEGLDPGWREHFARTLAQRP